MSWKYWELITQRLASATDGFSFISFQNWFNWRITKLHMTLLQISPSSYLSMWPLENKGNIWPVVLEMHTPRSTQPTQLSVYSLIHICTESVFHKSLPYNYAAKCFRGRRGRRSGWSPDFLTPSSTSTGDLWFTVISIPPQKHYPGCERGAATTSLCLTPKFSVIKTRPWLSIFCCLILNRL